MDLAETIHPNSDQVNAEDLIAGPITVTITAVKKGNADQPVFIELAEFAGRTYRPAKSMRRVLVAAWGTDAASYVGRRLVIFNDPKVKWAGQEVGGIRISAMSDIPETLTLALSVSRGKRAPFIVQPLDDGTKRDWLAELELTNEDLDAIGALGQAAKTAHASPAVMKAISDEYKRVQQIGATA